MLYLPKESLKNCHTTYTFSYSCKISEARNQVPSIKCVVYLWGRNRGEGRSFTVPPVDLHDREEGEETEASLFTVFHHVVPSAMVGYIRKALARC